MKTSQQQFGFAGISALLLALAFSFQARAAAPAGSASGEGPYRFVKEIPIGGEGGWDYLSVDSAAKRLYVSHGTKVVVLDLEGDKVAGEITDTPGVHGIAIANGLDRAFVSNGRENKVSVVDAKTLKTLEKVETGENPDAIIFEPSQQEVYAFNGRSHSATVIDAKTSKVVATIPLEGKPESATSDPKTGQVYVNLEDKNSVAVIDIKTHKVTAAWPIAPGEEASGMAMDPERHRLFLGCGNKLMVMMDYTSGKVVGSVPIGQGVDANAFDPGTQMAFASTGEGTVTIAHEDSPDKLTVVQNLKTQRGSRTMALDPATHKIYLAAVQYEATGDQAASGGRQRPKAVPGSFKVLVYGMAK
jgi:YVTN family beta-propeller protein